jgi:hypothetical protein
MKCLFTFLFVFIFGACVAQKNDTLLLTPGFAARWTPFSLFSNFPTAQFGVEYRLKSSDPRWSLAHDLGIVVKNGNNTESYSDKKGFKAITELRYYAAPAGNLPFYVSGELFFQRVNYTRDEFIGYDCENGDCSYYQYVSWGRVYTNRRASLKLGFLVFFSPRSRQGLFLDLSGGVAYGIRHSKDRNKPALSPRATSFGTDTEWPEASMIEDGEVIAPAFNLRLGVKFR